MRMELWLRRSWAAVATAGWASFLLAGCSGGEEGGAGSQGPVPVTLARVGGGSLERTIEAVANVEAAESVVITAEAPGRIVRILFTEGQRVRRGQPLFRLEADQESADLAAARADAAQLRQRLGRLERLVAEGAIARGVVDDLRRQVQAADARAASLATIVRDTLVRAPFAGVVGLRRVSPGALVQPGDELATLDDARSVRLRFTLPETQLTQVRIGAPVSATSPSMPDRSFSGRITGFDSRLGAGQRTLQAQAELDNPDGSWRPGMLADIRVVTETLRQAVTVPPLAVQVRGAVQFVFRAVDGCAQRVEVQTGQRERDRLEVLRGLRVGDSVVVEGFQDLSTGQPIVEARRVQGGVGGQDREQAGGEQDEEAVAEAQAKAQQRCQAIVARAARERRPAAPGTPR